MMNEDKWRMMDERDRLADEVIAIEHRLSELRGELGEALTRIKELDEAIVATEEKYA